MLIHTNGRIWLKKITEKRSTIKYMDELKNELSSMPGYVIPASVETEKMCLKSHTDPECVYIHQARKKGLQKATDDSLLKTLYLAMMDITKKWTGHRQDWGQIHSQLEIYLRSDFPAG